MFELHPTDFTGVEINDRPDPRRRGNVVLAIAVILAMLVFLGMALSLPGCTQATTTATTLPTTPQNIELMSVNEFENAYDTAIVILDAAAKDNKINASLAAKIRTAIPIARKARLAIDAANQIGDTVAANQAVSNGQSALNVLTTAQVAVGQ